jgi:hypothetical protein
VTVDCAVRDLDGRMVARLSGVLNMRDVTQVRLRLLKCLAEQPGGLLVDLEGLSVEDDLAMSVFVAISRQAARWPGIPVLLCAPTLRTDAVLGSAAYRRLPVFDSLDAAHEHLGQGGHALPSIADDLLPISGAARHGRNLATDACLRWDLPGLVAPASLICSELVSNGVDHAATMMRLRLSLGRSFLFIAVRDGSSAEPVLTDLSKITFRGRGLHIVAATAHSWGWLPAVDGKVVWASLRRP